MLVSLVSLFAVGCGDDDNENFVFTNANNQAVGALTFQFTNPQSASVDANTALLNFVFRNADNEIVLGPLQVAYNDTIVVENVPISAVSVEITALSNTGFPLTRITDTVEVSAGQTTQVDLSDGNVVDVTFDALTATPNPTNLTVGGTQTLSVQATFSNSATGATVPNSANDFTSANANVATVDANGVVTGVAVGNTTVNVEWTFDGTTRDDDVTVVVSDLELVGDRDVGIDTTNDLDATFSNGATGANTNVDENTTFAVNPAVAGFSIADGDNLVVADSVADNTTATITATYTDANGVVHTDSITVTAQDNISR